ncbi:MAG: phage holin family protein [Proteobacteria bacterium]|nr:phage holin family protein [Pseudomonadota bacterium]MCZ6783185.1 phage holin family protein [Pseudomonadota bacterium]
MTSFLAHLVVSAALLLLVAALVPGIRVGGAISALLAALVLGFVNALVKPLAILLTLPLTLVTFGLFLLVVNAAMLKLSAVIVPGFKVRGFLPALVGALLLAVLNVLVESLVGAGW